MVGDPLYEKYRGGWTGETLTSDTASRGVEHKHRDTGTAGVTLNVQVVIEFTADSDGSAGGVPVEGETSLERGDISLLRA